MGFGKSLGKFVKSPKRMAAAAVTMGGSEIWRGGLKDLLLGKKEEGSPEKYSQLEPEQAAALGIYRDEIKKLGEMDAAGMSKAQVNQLENQVRASADDEERRAQEMVAQRGLGKSSVGIGAILGTKRDLQNRISSVRAQEPMLRQEYENMRINRLGSLSSGINNMFNQRIYTPEVAGGMRSGGLLGPLLGITGAIYAGRAGANPVSGYQAGQGVGQSIANYNR